MIDAITMPDGSGGYWRMFKEDNLFAHCCKPKATYWVIRRDGVCYHCGREITDFEKLQMKLGVYNVE